MRISVVVPCFEHGELLAGAVASALAQEPAPLEVVVVDDGSREPVAAPAGVRLLRRARNGGLGAACADGLAAAGGDAVAYLAADDLWRPGHLAAVAEALGGRDAVLGSGLSTLAHRAGALRWRTREELESDDLRAQVARFGPADRAGPAPAAAWPPAWAPGTVVRRDHPDRRTRWLLARHDGGLNTFRSRYRVAEPLRLATSEGLQDERARYGHLRAVPNGDGPRVLLVGELAYNPERVLALCARGLHLTGCWIPDPLGFMTVGPLPFGAIPDVPADRWRDARPDVVYALLNWRSVPFARRVAQETKAAGVPLLWHFKEAPQRSLARGEWADLVWLHEHADHQLHCSPEEAEHLQLLLPGRADPASIGVLDGDLPPAAVREGDSPPFSDGLVHTVLAGRPHGIDRDMVRGLGAHGVVLHVHAHGTSGLEDVAPHHPPVAPDEWGPVLGRYDAGWLHPHRSRNGGDLRAAEWEDLNLPARLATYGAAGLPVLQPRNAGHAVATQSWIERTGAGLLYDDPAELADRPALASARAAMASARDELCFDHHADRLAGLLTSLAR